MIKTLSLAGYPEAILGRPSVDVTCDERTTAVALVRAVAGRNAKLYEALIDGDRVRSSTKLLVDGAVVDANLATVNRANSVTLLAALPCDG